LGLGEQMTDPYLNLFRGLVPPLLGTIDFTPLLGFLILQFLQGALENAATGDDPEADYW
jgi:YggT family protein